MKLDRAEFWPESQELDSWKPIPGIGDPRRRINLVGRSERDAESHFFRPFMATIVKSCGKMSAIIMTDEPIKIDE